MHVQGMGMNRVDLEVVTGGLANRLKIGPCQTRVLQDAHRVGVSGKSHCFAVSGKQRGLSVRTFAELTPQTYPVTWRSKECGGGEQQQSVNKLSTLHITKMPQSGHKIHW